MDTRGKPRHGRSAIKMVLVAVGMFGFGYLLVPLYDVFCEITGLNGKTGRVAEAAVEASYEADTSRMVTVQFVANNNLGMPWGVQPEVASMEVHPGQVYATSFRASNPTAHHTVGQAVPSVAPTVASRFFNKTECFCFDRQPLEAGESKDMPVRFVVSPSLPRHVKTVTLAYTFFDVSDQAVN